MKADCAATRDWLAGLGTEPGARPIDDLPFLSHCAGCPACARLRAAYSEFVDISLAQLAEGSEVEEPFGAETARTYHTFVEAALNTMASGAPEGDEAVQAEAALIEAVRQARPATGEASPPARSRRVPWIAAAILISAGLGAAAWWGLASTEGPSRPVSRPDARPVWASEGRVTVNGAPVQRGATLQAGAVIKTGPSGRLRAGRTDEAVVELGPSTTLEVLAWGAETRLLLKAGTARAQVTRRPEGSTFEVLTPEARVTVVGTVFSVHRGAEPETVVETISGRVQVERADGGLVGIVTAGGVLRVASPELRPAEPDPVNVETEPAPLAILEKPAERAPSGRGGATSPPSTHPEPRSRLRSRRVRGRRRVQARPEAPPAAAPGVGETPTSVEPGPVEPGPVEPAPMEDSLAQARILLAQGDDERAMAMLKRLPSTDWRRNALLGDAHHLAGRDVEARAAYRRSAGQVDPPPAAVLVELARVEARLKIDPAPTWRMYLAAHPDGPEAGRAHLAIGQSALGAADDQSAEPHLAAALSGSSAPPDTARALALLGRMLLKARRLDEADSLFTAHRDRVGLVGETALVGLVRVWLARQEFGEVRTLIDVYRRRFPQGRRADEIRVLEAALQKTR